MEITKDIYQVDGVKGVNCYLVKIKNGLMLVDSGMPKKAQVILDFIKKQKEKLLFIVLTHSDIDHMGGVAEIKRQTNAKIAIHVKDAPVLSGEGDKKAKGFIGVVFKILLLFMKVEYIKPDILLKDGDEIGGFKVIHVPGHTEGSICLFRKSDGVVFSGDVLLGDNEGNLREPNKRFAFDYKQTLESAEKIKSLKFKLLLPGHGKPVRS